MAYFQSASSYAHVGKQKLALEDMNQVIKDKPDFYMAYFQRASFHVSLGDYIAAVADLSTAIKLKPETNIF
jgi:tetratricopeptide (TPR) repeat protein